ncbi:hypothetical protein Hanom_Chr06g00557741 [Helianthus anomalus]
MIKVYTHRSWSTTTITVDKHGGGAAVEPSSETELAPLILSLSLLAFSLFHLFLLESLPTTTHHSVATVVVVWLLL